MMKDKIYKDTYFFSKEEAQIVAKQQNRSGVFNNLQICYYNGDKNDISKYENLISVPIDNFCDYMTETPNRIVQDVQTANLFVGKEKNKMVHLLNSLQNIALDKKSKIMTEYQQVIKEEKINFDEPLRILFVTTRLTTVLQYVMKNLADAFDEFGYDTFISIEENNMQSWGANEQYNNPYYAWHLKNIYEYKPHIVINLDWINNQGLSPDTYNFIWFQDPMPILYDNTPIRLRAKDYIFSLQEQFSTALLKKGISKDKIFHQNFATNPKIFFEDKSIKKENKIVFLGSNYNFDKKFSDYKDIDKLSLEITNKMFEKTLTLDLLEQYSIKYKIPYQDLESWFVVGVVRREAVKWMCVLKDIDIEVYGTDAWLKVPEVAPYYKGLLPYGKEMAKVYNSAKYALVVHPQYRYQQRLMEISACGSIPVVYKGNLIKETFHHEENILSFSTLKEFQNCIGKEPKKDSKQISDDISYKNMAQKIIKIVKEKEKLK